MSRRRRRAATPVAAIAIIGLVGGCATTAGVPSHLSAAAISDLGDRATTIIETVNRTNGEVLRTHGSDRPAMCVTEVFGIDPASATRERVVETAYVWAFCAERMPCHQQGDLVDVPVVVHFGDQPWIEVPAEDDYAAAVSRLFPGQLAGLARSGPPDADALAARLVAITGPPPQPDQTVGC
jgi:hypothetical protein